MKKLLSIIVCFMMGISVLSMSIKKASAQTVQVNSTETLSYNLNAGYYVLDLSGNQACRATLYYDSTYITSADSTSSYNDGVSPTFEAKQSGTYTLKLDTSGANIPVNVNLYQIEKGGDLSLDGTIVGTSGMNSNDLAYYKVNVKKAGVLSVTISGLTTQYSSNLILCNNKKKSLTGNFGFLDHGKKIQLGVKKGTYYLGIKSVNKSYTITTVFKNRSILGGTTKKKAKTLKKKKTYNTTLIAGRKSYWFKINNPKASKINISLKSSVFRSGSGYYSVYFYYKKQKHLSGFINSGDNTYKGYIYTTNNRKSKKADKGTYYIQVVATGKPTGTLSMKIS